MKLHQRTAPLTAAALAAAIGFVIAPAALAQTPPPAAPAAQAAPRKLISPMRGEVTVEFTNPSTVRKGGNVVTTMVIKNTSSGPIAGFRLEESWADKTGNLAGGETYLLMPCPDMTLRPIRMRPCRRMTLAEFRTTHLTTLKLTGKLNEAAGIMREIDLHILGPEIMEEVERLGDS